MKKITVQLGTNSYDIHIGAGLLDSVGPQLTNMGFCGKVVIITDSTVQEFYGAALERNLKSSGFEVTTLVIPPGEQQKSLETAAGLYARLCDAYVERNTPVLALGGGVIGDLAGFVAATYLRGLPLIQLPTTLLAQVDSSIGGKTAVDHGKLKNMVGTFYQPRLVLADISVIKSLDARQVGTGLAEVIKYAVIKDAAFFDYLEKNIDRVFVFDAEVLENIVYTSARIKADIVAKDEKDVGLRRILNFGHTIGHAVESASGFSLSHGEAVALGMLAAAKVSLKMGLFSEPELHRLVTLIRKAGLPFEMPPLNLNEVMQAIKHDKKIAQGKMHFVFAKSIGDAVISGGQFTFAGTGSD